MLDSSGAAIVGASIAVRNVGTAFTRNLTSDSQGRYFASELPIGDYEVEALNPGFQTVVRRGIRLTVGSQPVVDLQLPVGQGEETVNVTGELSQVETTSGTLSSLVNQTQMRELPLNGRNYEQLILLAPGALSYPAGVTGLSQRLDSEDSQNQRKYRGRDGKLSHMDSLKCGEHGESFPLNLPLRSAFPGGLFCL